MRIFHVQFSEKDLTGNAGLVHLGRFAEKLGLDKMLQQHISIQRGENATYSNADVILMLGMGVLAGAKHISDLAILRADTALRSLFKWNDFSRRHHLRAHFQALYASSLQGTVRCRSHVAPQGLV